MSEDQSATPSRVLVVAAALVAEDGSVCMQQRPLGKAHGGLWEFPGGKVEPGETPRAALAREITEELGVVLDPAALIPAGFADDPAPGGVTILLYIAAAWSGEVRCIEGEALRWVRPAAIAALSMPPLDYPLAEGLCKVLAEGAI